MISDKITNYYWLKLLEFEHLLKKKNYFYFLRPRQKVFGFTDYFEKIVEQVIKNRLLSLVLS